MIANVIIMTAVLIILSCCKHQWNDRYDNDRTKTDVNVYNDYNKKKKVTIHQSRMSRLKSTK